MPKKKPLKREQVWKREWFVPNKAHPYALTSQSTFVRRTQDKMKNLKKGLKNQKFKDKQQEWLENQPAYQMHQPARRRYKRRAFVVTGMDEMWQADLSDMTWQKKVNGGYAWMLFCIDMLSKKVWTRPLKQKSGPEMARALQEIFDEVMKEGIHTVPRVIYVDKGSEFYNHNVKELLASYPIPIKLHSGESDMKAAAVERVQRTIKHRMWKIFYETGSYRWIEILPKIIDAYNSSIHSTTGFAPNAVTRENEETVYNNSFQKIDKEKQEYAEASEKKKELYFQFAVGDFVRLSLRAKLFAKRYLPQWSEEIYEIRARDIGPPPYYRLKDQKDEIIVGTFYEAELQRVNPDAIESFRIEQILKRRTNPKTKKKEVFVKYKGWPDKFNEWIDAKAVKQLTT